MGSQPSLKERDRAFKKMQNDTLKTGEILVVQIQNKYKLMFKYAFVFGFILAFAPQIKAQNYCEVQNSFLSPSFPQTIDTFTV